MDAPKIVITDKVCIPNIENKLLKCDDKNDYYNSKEAIFILLVKNVKNSFKKVGLPTFVRNKKCAKNIFKKAGLHTIGIMQWLKIIITIAVLSSSKNFGQ